MTHRNRALLDLCHEAPCFLLLGFEGCGRDASVPAHSDMIRHGRGKDHKSHDCFAVPGCPVCHEHFKRSELGPDGYHEAWTAAMERWILYLWVSGKIRLTDINQRPKELSMEAPMCKICEHRHYVRDPHQFGKNTSADEAKDRKVGNARRDSSADCSSSRFTAQASGTLATIPAATAAHGRVNHAFDGKSGARPARTKADKVTPGKRKTAPKKKAKKKGKR